jgi:hypothetical protein
MGSFVREGHASYNSLQVLFKAQTGSASTFQASYTWSHSIGNVELDNSSNGVNQEAETDQTAPKIDKGNTNINRPNMFVANEVLYLPKLANQNWALKGIVGGWEANSILTFTEGTSFSVFSNGTSGQLGSTLSTFGGTGYNSNNRPLYSGLTTCTAGTGGYELLNYGAFTLQGYTIGTFPKNMVPRGICRGAGTKNVDGELAKNWMIREKIRVKFAMDFFDLFNKANFNSSNLESTGFGASNGNLCGAAQTECTMANNVVNNLPDGTPKNAAGAQGPGTPTGFGTPSGELLNEARTLQYSLHISF